MQAPVSYTHLSALASWAHKRNVGFSGLVSVGSTADVNFADLLDFYALDPTTRAILIYVERLTDPQSFMSAARAASVSYTHLDVYKRQDKPRTKATDVVKRTMETSQNTRSCAGWF